MLLGKKYKRRQYIKKPREIRKCAAPGCENTFEVIITSTKRFCCRGHNRRGGTMPQEAIEKIRKYKSENNPMDKLENRIKVSRALMGHIVEDATKRKIHDSEKGKIIPQDLRKRWSVTKQGVGNPNWQGGLSFIPWTPDFTNKLKERVRERDGRVCQLCGISENENMRRLSIHHIDYNKENCSESNLISLCVVCHGKVNFNRNRYTQFFTNLLKEARP
jgi:hypothetical protein